MSKVMGSALAQSDRAAPSKLSAAPADPAPATPRRKLWRGIAEGLILGALIGLAVMHFGVWSTGHHTMATGAAVGTVLGLSRIGRRLVWLAAGGVIVAYVVIGYTPIMPPLVRGLERRDTLRPAPAVVVLGAVVHEDGSLADASQDRFLGAYAVLRGGYAPRMVVTDPEESSTIRSWRPALSRQMRELGLDYPVEVVGPVHNTADEAKLVAKFARERGWDEVILVTHPWHMKRAAAAFEKAGLHVICAPCNEGRYDLSTMSGPNSRIAGFRYWFREAVAYQVYRYRGQV